MRYFNTVTKAVFDSDFKITGDNWVIDGEQPKKTEAVLENAEQPKETEQEQVVDATYNAINKAQIMQELDAFGVEYDKKASKKDLYDLMMAQGE